MWFIFNITCRDFFFIYHQCIFWARFDDFYKDPLTYFIESISGLQFEITYICIYMAILISNLQLIEFYMIFFTGLMILFHLLFLLMYEIQARYTCQFRQFNWWLIMKYIYVWISLFLRTVTTNNKQNIFSQPRAWFFPYSFKLVSRLNCNIWNCIYVIKLLM